MLQTPSTRLRVCLNFDVTMCFSNMEKKLQICSGKQSARFFGPFHQADRVRVKIFSETGLFPFCRIIETIEIKVIEV